MTTQKPPRLLLVSHSADRSGAPLFLLHFANWIKSNATGVEIDILLKDGGELTALFLAHRHLMTWTLGNTFIAKYLDKRRLWGQRRQRLVNDSGIAKWHQKRVLDRIVRRSYDLVFVNSFANAEIIPLLASATSCPVICRAPELHSVVYEYCGINEVRAALPYIDRFIAVSDPVRDFMVTDLGIPDGQITTIPGFFRPGNPAPRAREAVRRKLRLHDRTFLVCGCGSISIRKGTDLFVRIASDVVQSHPDLDIAFLWVGGDLDSSLYHDLADEVAKCNMSDKIKFIGSTDAPCDFYSASDLFALTSREDPFPLVALEAAHEGLPIVCFNGPVGSAKLVAAGAGLVVPHLSAADFSTAILYFASDMNEARRYGSNGRKLVKPYSQDAICRKVFSLIKATIASSSAGPGPIRPTDTQ